MIFLIDFEYCLLGMCNSGEINDQCIIAHILLLNGKNEAVFWSGHSRGRHECVDVAVIPIADFILFLGPQTNGA